MYRPFASRFFPLSFFPVVGGAFGALSRETFGGAFGALSRAAFGGPLRLRAGVPAADRFPLIRFRGGVGES